MDLAIADTLLPLPGWYASASQGTPPLIFLMSFLHVELASKKDSCKSARRYL